MNPIAGKLHLAANKKNLGIYTENGTRIAFINATLTSDEQIGTYIVRAVNSHQSLIDALEFYADPKRYEGPNQNPIPNDKYDPRGVDSSYIHDITKDSGAIAKAALALAKEPT